MNKPIRKILRKETISDRKKVQKSYKIKSKKGCIFTSTHLSNILPESDIILSREAVNCQYGGHGGSLLHAAVAEGDRKAASLLIAAGARFLFMGNFIGSAFQADFHS